MSIPGNTFARFKTALVLHQSNQSRIINHKHICNCANVFMIIVNKRKDILQ